MSSQQLEASLRGGTTPSSRADAVLRCLLDELQADIESLQLQAGIDFTTVAHFDLTPPMGCVQSRVVAPPVPRAAPRGPTPLGVVAAEVDEVKTSLRETRAKRLLRLLGSSQAAARRRAEQVTEFSSCISHVNSGVRGTRDHPVFQLVSCVLSCEHAYSALTPSHTSIKLHTDPTFRHFWQRFLQLVSRALDQRHPLDPAQGYDYHAIPLPDQLQNASGVAAWLVSIWERPCLVIRFSGCEHSLVKRESLHERNVAVGRRQLARQRARRRRMEARGQ